MEHYRKEREWGFQKYIIDYNSSTVVYGIPE